MLPFIDKINKHRGKIGRYLELVADTAALFLQIRDKPRPLDWIAIGTNAVSLGFSIHSEVVGDTKDNTCFFDDDDVWAPLPDPIAKIIEPILPRPVMQEDSDAYDQCVVRSVLGDTEHLWWLTDRQTARRTSPLYFEMARRDQLQDAIGATLRAHVGSHHIRVTPGGLVPDVYELPEALIRTPLLDYMERRVKLFFDAGRNRAYLLDGPPGTGKTIILAALTKTLGLPSLRVDGSVFASNDGIGALVILLEALRPRILIIDDIDRINQNRVLLELLERAHTFCDIVMASSNNKQWLSQAVRRPGRFDDIVDVPALATDVVKQFLLDDDYDLAERLCDWPIVYIKEYTDRVQVLGRDIARAELPALEARVLGNAVPEEQDD